MSLDSYNIAYYLTPTGWHEVAGFKEDPNDIIEEWTAYCRQSGIKSPVVVTWRQTRPTTPGKEKLAEELRSMHPWPNEFS